MIATVEPVSADQLMAGAGKTFYRAARLLPRSVRHEVVALYAFCRAVDDLADEPSCPLHERQQALLQLGDALKHGPLAELRAAGWPFAAQGLLAEAAALLVEAATADLAQQQPQTEDGLLAYAFGVAGTVGVMMAEVLHAEPDGFMAAIALGMAMQLSNIARDVAEDLHHGRVYLPGSWVSAHALQQTVEHNEPIAALTVIRATEHVLSLAERLYRTAYDGIWSLPWGIRWSILAAGMCYREIGVQVGRDVPRSWQQRTVVSAGRKSWLILLAGLCCLLPRFWRRPARSASVQGLGSLALTQTRALGVIL